jgi:hypothetical protein
VWRPCGFDSLATLEADKKTLQAELFDCEQKINESVSRDYDAELLQRTLQDFRTVFTTLTPVEQCEALQCILKGVTVHPDKLSLEIFELEEFRPSSQKRNEWLPDLYDLRTLRFEFRIPFRKEKSATREF